MTEIGLTAQLSPPLPFPLLQSEAHPLAKAAGVSLTKCCKAILPPVQSQAAFRDI